MSRQWKGPGFCLASMASALLLVSAGQAGAQQPAAQAPAAQAPAMTPAQGQTFGLSAGLKRSWNGFKNNVREAAEKMPEPEYSFKPTPEVRSFAELVGHVAVSMHGLCARVKGEATTPPFDEPAVLKATAKAELVKAMQAAVTYCDGVYDAQTDESLLQPIQVGPNRMMPTNLLWYNISHANEHYGNMVTYMRLKGLVPPSTERMQKPKPSAND